MEFTLLWAALLGIGSALGVAHVERRAGLSPQGAGLGDLAVGAAVAGLAIGRLGAMLLVGVNPLAHPGDILIVRAGVDPGFASLGGLGFAALSGRRHLLPTLDALAPVAMAGLAGWHAGCLFRGACLGTVSSLPWAVPQAGSALTRHPVEIYAAVLFAAAAFVLFRWLRRGVTVPGGPAFAGLALAGAIRLATQPMRPSLGPGPVGWYAAALSVGLTGAALLLLLRRRTRPSSAR